MQRYFGMNDAEDISQGMDIGLGNDVELAAARTAAGGGFIAQANTGTVGKSGVKLADGVLSGYEWKGNNLTYAFPDQKTDYGYGGEKNNGFSPVNGAIKETFRWILDQNTGNAANNGFSVEGFTQLNISQGSHTKADIRVAESSSANPTAYAYYPDGGERAGDIWIGKDSIYDTPKPGNYANATMIHELGHALGLKHGHVATYYDKIKTILEGQYDSLEYSVMTYHSYAGQPGTPGYTNEKSGFPQTFMMADIRALQHMYGADFSTNGGKTVYKWSPDSGDTKVNGKVAIDMDANRIFATIWDGGGNDTYDLGAYSNGVKVDLRPGKFSVFKESQLADLNVWNPGTEMAGGNIYNALLFKGDKRSLIENAVGGSGNDRFLGNVKDNILTGKAGNDTFVFVKNGGDDTVSDFGRGGDRANLSDFDYASFAKLQKDMSNIGGGVLIKFGDGDTLFLDGVKKGDLDSGDFIL